MLKKQYRLCKRLDFRRTYQRGKSVKNRNFVLYYSPNNLGECRLGYSVSKKIGKAVIRNKVKRRLREACRLNIEAFPKGYNYIFIARQPIVFETVSRLESQILTKLAEINLKPRAKRTIKK